MNIERSALVMHSALDMYRLVRDVPSYPRFLRWCTDATVHEEGEDYQLASLAVALGGIEQSFTTRNALEPGERLAMRLVEGPFRELFGEWRFIPLGSAGSKVVLNMEFEFRRGLISSAFQRGFRSVADHMVQEFGRRADQLARRGRFGS